MTKKKHPFEMKLTTLENCWYYANYNIWFPINTEGYSPTSRDSKIARGLLK